MVNIAESVWKTWRSVDADNIVLSIESPRDDLFDLVDQAVAPLRAGWEEEEIPGLVEVAPLPDGVALLVNYCHDLRAVLDRVVDVFTETGLDDVTIAPLRAAKPMPWHPLERFPSIQARLVLRASSYRHVNEFGVELNKFVMSQDDLESALTFAVDFCLGVPGHPPVVRVDAGLARHLELPPAAALQLLRAQIGPDPAAPRERFLSVVGSGTHGHWRSVNLNMVHAEMFMAQGLDHDGAASFDWRRTVTLMTDFIAHAPAVVQQATLSRGYDDPATALLVLHPDAPMERGQAVRVDEKRLLLQDHVSDAYGVIMIPAPWSNRLPDDGPWTTTRIGDRVLLESADPAAWFEADERDPTLFTDARRSLGELLAWNVINSN